MFVDPHKQQHLTQNRNKAPRLSSLSETEGAQPHSGVSKAKWLFCAHIMLLDRRNAVLDQCSSAEYPGLPGQGKHYTGDI